MSMLLLHICLCIYCFKEKNIFHPNFKVSASRQTKKSLASHISNLGFIDLGLNSKAQFLFIFFAMVFQENYLDEIYFYF